MTGWKWNYRSNANGNRLIRQLSVNSSNKKEFIQRQIANFEQLTTSKDSARATMVVMIRRAIKFVINRILISPLRRCAVAKFLLRTSCRRHFWQLAACLTAARLDGWRKSHRRDVVTGLGISRNLHIAISTIFFINKFSSGSTTWTFYLLKCVWRRRCEVCFNSWMNEKHSNDSRNNEIDLSKECERVINLTIPRFNQSRVHWRCNRFFMMEKEKKQSQMFFQVLESNCGRLTFLASRQWNKIHNFFIAFERCAGFNDKMRRDNKYGNSSKISFASTSQHNFLCVCFSNWKFDWASCGMVMDIRVECRWSRRAILYHSKRLSLH